MTDKTEPSTKAVFVSDLHGRHNKYEELWELAIKEKPGLIFLGGDLLPHGMVSANATDPFHQDFIGHFLVPGFRKVQEKLGPQYPDVFLVMGNDDARFEEPALITGGEGGIWTCLNNRKAKWQEYTIFGYPYVPPTPFQLKDWEKFDVSRYVDVGSVSPLEGRRTFPVSKDEIEYGTIQQDLEKLSAREDLTRAIFLFHVPPYQTALDRIDAAGRMVDHAPLDEHIGSIAVKRFIEDRQPYLTLHGHAHESSMITGRWSEKVGKTLCLSAAHTGPHLEAVIFSLELPEQARRIVL